MLEIRIVDGLKLDIKLVEDQTEGINLNQSKDKIELKIIKRPRVNS